MERWRTTQPGMQKSPKTEIGFGWVDNGNKKRGSSSELKSEVFKKWG